MASPNRREGAQPRSPGWGSKRSGACPTQEQVPGQLAMLRKAQEFFQTCDAEGKGFIARSDMQVGSTR